MAQKWFKRVCIITTLFMMFSFPVLAETRDRIVYASASWAPYAYIDGNGTAQGVYIDILKTIFEDHMDIVVEFQEYPWKRAQANVMDGLADILITVATVERLQYTVKSDAPLFEMYLHVYTYKNHPQLSEIRKIESGDDILALGLIPVTNLGNIWHRNTIDQLGVKTHYVPSEENAFLFLAAKRADITIEPLTAGNYLIKKLDLVDKIIPTEGRFGPITFHLLLGKQSKFLSRMEAINRVIGELRRTGRISEIFERYSKIQ